MSKSETDTHLRYGQGILLKGYKPEKDPLQGCLTVKGFADTKCNYETIDDILFFKNYRNAIFEFLPAGNFEINDELTKLTEKVVDTKQEEKKRNQIIKTLEPRGESQKNQFDLTIKSKKKSTIKFGDYVIFRHVDSDSYLSGTIRPSQGSNGAFSVEVSEKLSRFLIFQILPYRSFENQSMEIPFDSPVLIKNIANNGYLTFEKIGMNTGEDDMNKYIVHKPTESDESFKIPVKTRSLTSKKYELVTHFVDLSIQDQLTPMPWLFKMHFKDVDNDSLIQHDIVYLQHTQNGGILSAIGEDVILKESKEETDGLSFYESLWEIESHDQTPNSYIMRHLMSGMTLGIENKDENPYLPKLFDISEGKDKARLGVVELILAKKEGGVINSESNVNIAWGDYTLDIVEEEEKEEEHEIQAKSSVVTDQIIPLKRMKKQAVLKVQYDVKRLRFTGDISKHCFVIQEIDDSLKKELLFALSFHSTIINLREDLKEGAVQATKRISYIRMMKVTQKIAEINDFLKDCRPDDPEKQFKLSSTKRQNICKDLGLSELLFELLFFMKENMNEDIFKDKANQSEKFKEMYKTIYEVIINLIMNNQIFKIHVSKWIQIILNDVIEKEDEQVYFKALMELLKDNNFFTENFVTEKLITLIYEKMTEEKDRHKQKDKPNPFYEKRYLEILRKLCICGETILSGNQVMVLNQFIKKMAKNNAYNFEIFLDEDGEISCNAAIDKGQLKKYKFDLLQTKLQEKIPDTNLPRYPLAWQYYMTYLNLLADLTQGRSKEIQHHMNKILPLDMLTILFEKYELNEFEVPVIKILHYLYFENEFFYPIEQENRITDFLSINRENPLKVNQFTSRVSPWDTLEKVLLTILAKLQASGPILASEIKKNQALYSLLCITRETLNLGFWIQKEDLMKIYSYILNILQKHEQTNYEEIAKIKYENQLLIFCKIECINIIDLIIYQDNYMSSQIMNKVFKEFEFPESAKDFSIEVQKLLGVPEEIEFAKNFLEFYRENVKEYENIVNENIFEVVLELANYHSQDLTKKSLSVLEKVFESQQNRLNLFYEQLYICEPNRVQFYKYLIQLRNKFFTLEDFNTPSITYDNQSNNYFYIHKQPGGVMQDLYLINELMKNENNLSNLMEIPTLVSSHTFENLSTDRLMNFTNERKTNNLPKQKLVDATNIHLKILFYINQCSEIPESELAAKLLHLCYKFLVGLIENHQEIKMKLLGYLPHIMNHMDSNIGCLDFLKEMYDNNKHMLFSEGEIVKLIKRVCDIVEKQTDTFYRSKVLDFLRYLIYLNSKPLKSNQILILKTMQDDQYKNIMLKPDPTAVKNLVTQYEKDNGEDLELANKFIVCGQQLTYMSSYFQILTSLVDQNNNVNSGKLEKRFPFDKILDMIKECKKCYFLKRNLRAFLNRMYYFFPNTDKYLNNILTEDLLYIEYDLNELIKLKNRKDFDKLQSLKFTNPVRFSFFESYIYLNFEEILFSLYNILNTIELRRQIQAYFASGKQEAKQSIYICIRIAEKISWLKNYFSNFNNVPTTSIIKFLQKSFKDLFQKLPYNIYEPAFQRQMTDETEENKIAYMNEKILSGEITQFYVEGSTAYQNELPLSFLTEHKKIEPKQKKPADWSKLSEELKKIFTRKKREFDTVDDQVKYKLDKIISGLKMSPKIKKAISANFEKKLFESSSPKEEDRKQDDIEDKKLLDYISILIQINNENPTLFSDEQKIFLLKVLASLFEKANKSESEEDAEKGEIDEWEAEQWEANADKIEKLQEQFHKNKVGSFIISLAKGNICENIKLANYTLLCGISFLYGGKTQNQDSIRDELKEDTDNRVFKNIKNLIIKLGGLIRKCIDQDKAHLQHLFNQQDEKVDEAFVLTTVDNYDFYDINEKFVTRRSVEQPHYTDEALYYQQCIVTYRRAFKFLQLLCENNNIENKKFIREQSATPSIDFIELATKQLRNIFLAVCYDIREIPIFLLDFILEVTQIPVIDNQEAFIKSSFFEDLCLLYNTLQKPDEMKNRGFLEDSQKIKQLFSKSIQIVLSNLQGGRKDNFKTLDEKLEQAFLINLLDDNLREIGVTNKTQFKKKIKQLTSPKSKPKAQGKQNEEGGQEPKEEGEKVVETDFDESIIRVLEIITIFKKFKDVIGEESKIVTFYEKSKQKEFEKEKKKPAGEKDKRKQEGHGEDEQPIIQKASEEKETKPEKKKPKKELYQALEDCLLKIEIADQSNEIQSVYFPKHPVFDSLSDGLKDYVMGQVSRGTHRQKVVSLLGFVDGIRQKIEESYRFEKIENLSEKDMNDSYKNASYLSLLICVYISLVYEIFIEHGGAEFGTKIYFSFVRFALSLAQLYYSCNYIYLWYKLRVWYKPEPVSREKKEKGGDSGQSEDSSKQKVEEQIQGGQAEAPTGLGLYLGKIKQYYQMIIDYRNSQEPKFYQASDFFKIFLFVLISFISTFIYPPLIFIHIIDYLLNLPLLGDIVQAIVQVSKPLLLVSMMGVVFTFIFCTVTLSNYVKNVYEQTPEEDMCEGMIGCILDLFVSGVILQTMDSFEMKRFTYDTIYSIFFGMLFGNIVSGLLLDTFGALRESSQELDDDKNNKCYICNIDRETLEQKDETFQKHIHQKHYLWNYIFYIIALQRKSETDYTGLEYYISQKYNQPDEDMDETWFPDGQGSFELTKVVDKMIRKLDEGESRMEKSKENFDKKIEEFNGYAEELKSAL